MIQMILSHAWCLATDLLWIQKKTWRRKPRRTRVDPKICWTIIQNGQKPTMRWVFPGIILCMIPANQIWLHTVTPYIIGWVHTQNSQYIQVCCVSSHIDVETKWPPFCRHFHINFLELKLLYFLKRHYYVKTTSRCRLYIIMTLFCVVCSLDINIIFRCRYLTEPQSRPIQTTGSRRPCWWRLEP